jgi:hypothetical protein
MRKNKKIKKPNRQTPEQIAEANKRYDEQNGISVPSALYTTESYTPGKRKGFLK